LAHLGYLYAALESRRRLNGVGNGCSTVMFDILILNCAPITVGLHRRFWRVFQKSSRLKLFGIFSLRL